MVVDDNPRDQNDTEEINPWNTHFPKMAVIKDSSLPETTNDFSIFPPTNHENLHLSSSPSPSSSSSSSSSMSSSGSSSFSPSDSDQSDPDSPVASPPKRPAFGASDWWLRIGVGALRSRALGFARNGVVWWKGSWRSGAVLAAALATAWSLWIRARQRRRIRSLVSVVKERDEKISQLLHQIAQLNEVLIARHKLLVSKVPN